MQTINDIQYKFIQTYFFLKSFLQFQYFYNFPNELLIIILIRYKNLLLNDFNEFIKLFHDESFYTNLKKELLFNYNLYILNNDRNLAEEATITNAFNSEWIDSMIDDTRKYKLNQDIPYVFITIDPSAGISRSLYILVSMFYLNNQCVVCKNNLFKNNKDQFYSILEYYNIQYQLKINDYF